MNAWLLIVSVLGHNYVAGYSLDAVECVHAARAYTKQVEGRECIRLPIVRRPGLPANAHLIDGTTIVLDGTFLNADQEAFAIAHEIGHKVNRYDEIYATLAGTADELQFELDADQIAAEIVRSGGLDPANGAKAITGRNADYRRGRL